MPRRGCSRTCRRLLERGAEIVATEGRAEILLADGRRTSAWRIVPDGGGLLILAPRAGAEGLGVIRDDEDGRWQAVDTELPAAALIHSSDPSGPMVQLQGWLCAAPRPVVSRLAVRFADRHPTTDLLGAGEDWFLLRLEVVEVQVCGSGRVLSVADEEASRWLASTGVMRPPG